jgi:hypothetical protein
MTSKHIEQAREALAESVGLGVVGEFLEEKRPDSGLLELTFACSQRGYQGWHWVVSFTDADKRKQPLLAEVNLVAGEGAQLAPPWVPWSDRLADFRRQLKEEGKAASDAEADDLIAGMAFASDDEYSEDSENESRTTDPDAVKKPPRVRVRQRRIKRAEDQESEQPESAAASEN